MKKMKLIRLTALFLCILSALSFAACGRLPEVRHTAAPTQAPTPVPPTPTPLLPDPETQKTILKNRQSVWAFTDEYSMPWFYTFTDLDHNGRLEVIAASTQGTGIFTRAHFYELAFDGANLVNVYNSGMSIEGSDDWPEIVVDSLACWYDKNLDRWYYVCENATRDGAAHGYLSWQALSLKDGVAEWEPLAYKEVTYDENGYEQVVCTDAKNRPISAADYDNAPAQRFAGMEGYTLPLDWTRVDRPDAAPMPGTVTQPGTDAPAVTASPAVTAAPMNAAPVITKNPTSEYLAAGGKTWFIAHAQNADSISWEFMSPDGIAYSLQQAMTMHPGLSLEVLPEDTVAVSNVPASANGWGMRARFTGPGGAVVSETAYLYVKDYAKAYAGILENYRAAYYSGQYLDPGYMMQNGMSEMAAYANNAGYALIDLDSNGIPELVIEGLGTDSFGSGVIYGLYTLVDDVPIELAVSQARMRYYLLSDNRILYEGSGGASYSDVVAMRLQGDMTVEEEMVFTRPFTNPDGTQDTGFYFQNGYSAELPSDKSIRLTMEEFDQAMNMLESGIYTPQLNSIW